MLRFDYVNRSVLCMALALLLVGAARAQPKFVRSDFEFTSVAPPVTLGWQLATPGGQHVDLSITGIQPAAGSTLAYIITPKNAAQFGVDFAAWSLAVNDPAYSRSIMTWGGVTKESAIVRTFPHIELDDLRVFVDAYEWPEVGVPEPVRITAFAFDAPVVPEPATWLLAASCSILIVNSSVYRYRRNITRSSLSRVSPRGFHHVNQTMS